MNNTLKCSDDECLRLRQGNKPWCSMHCQRVWSHGDTTSKYVRHGMKGTPEYRSWCHMKDRCHNPKGKDYHRYGARGITVCPEWIKNFKAFYDHIGPRPSAKHSVERINNSRGYEPGNVKWATPQDQSNNRRSNRQIEWNGAVHSQTEWSKLTGIPMSTIYNRVKAGTDPFRKGYSKV